MNIELICEMMEHTTKSVYTRRLYYLIKERNPMARTPNYATKKDLKILKSSILQTMKQMLSKRPRVELAVRKNKKLSKKAK